MQLTLEVQEDKLAFFLELIRNFSFIQLNEADKLLLSEELLAIVEERLAAYEAAPDNVITWEQVRASAASRL
jgi:putative addiction module component (TIGR02574 family)